MTMEDDAHPRYFCCRELQETIKYIRDRKNGRKNDAKINKKPHQNAKQ